MRNKKKQECVLTVVAVYEGFRDTKSFTADFLASVWGGASRPSLRNFVLRTPILPSGWMVSLRSIRLSECQEIMEVPAHYYGVSYSAHPDLGRVRLLKGFSPHAGFQLILLRTVLQGPYFTLNTCDDGPKGRPRLQ
jgi:hypothetical protein